MSADKPDPPVTVRLFEFEVPPPGAGVDTVTANTPPVSVVPTGTVAVNFVLSANVVGHGVPATNTAEPLTKFLPLTVSVSDVVPDAVVAGEIEVTWGVGLFTLN